MNTDAVAGTMQPRASAGDENNVADQSVQCFVPPAFNHLAPVLANWLAHAARSSEHVEIEGRVGTYGERKFDASVDEQWFNDKLAYFMAPGARWDRTEEETTTAYLFDNGVRGVKRADETAEFVRKVRKAHFDLALDGCAYSVRLAHSFELPMAAPCASAIWVRLRRRKSFYYKQFRYDFTWILEGPTLQAAKQADMKHEMEIEFVGDRMLAGDNGEHAHYLAMSLLFKMHDLVTPNGTDVTLDGARKINVLKMKFSQAPKAKVGLQ